MNKEITHLSYNYNNIEIKLIFYNQNIWINQSELAKLFNISKSSVSRYTKNILENVLDKEQVVAKFATAGNDNKIYIISHYAIELTEIIGRRLDPIATESFITWAQNIIRDTISKKALPIEVFEDGNFKLEVSISPDEETVWLTQEQIAMLYSTSKQLISFHSNNILKEGELEKATVKKNLTVQIENGREVNREMLSYNLDMILSIGYRINSKKGIIFRRWANKILKQYLYKGYTLDESRVTIYKDNYLELTNTVLKLENKVQMHDEQINELKGVIDKSYNKIFFKGQFYDAYSLLVDIIQKATKTIFLIDNYIDHKTLDILSNRNDNVALVILTKCNSLPTLAINNFIKQYSNLKILTSNDFHDRFIIIDNKFLYHIGASLKDIGKKCFAITEMKKDTLELIVEKLKIIYV